MHYFIFVIIALYFFNRNFDMETKDGETITSSLLKMQNHKLMNYKDIVLVMILLNLVVLTLTLIQEIVCFEDLEDYEIILISIIVKTMFFLMSYK